MLDVNAAQASDAATELKKDFPYCNIIAKAVDVTNAESVANAFEETASELGGIDMLCCFAGVVGCAHAIDLTHEQWKRALDINCSGAFLCAQAAAR